MAATISIAMMAASPAMTQHAAAIVKGHTSENVLITSGASPLKPTPQISPASFPGGEKALAEYLASAFQYPEEAILHGVTGTVVIRFTIGTDGTLSDPQIVQSVLPSVDDAALQVLDQMPRWQPALMDGKPVEATGQIPFVLTLQ